MATGFTKFSFFFFLTVLMISCNQKKWPGPDEIYISWEVLSNTYDEQATVKAEFILTNHSEYPLEAQDWELYYNQSPRFLLSVDEDSAIGIEHISGDWYKMFPLEGFELLPDSSVRVVYESRYWWIKESDAPQGLYFIFGGDNERKRIVEVENFHVLPFLRKEQLTRHRRDQEPIPSPELSFYLNSNMQPIAQNELLPVVPSPFFFQQGKDTLAIDERWTIHYEKGLEFEAEYIRKQLQHECNCELAMEEEAQHHELSILLKTDSIKVNDTRAEAYHLTIDSTQVIEITGSDKAGVFYGIQSLLSLLKPAPVADSATEELLVPFIRIEDAPRFGYRGVHVDVVRNFHSTSALKKIIDVLAFYKINTLHLHLTDDEGWRIAIASLPELTEIGAQRHHTQKDAPALHPAYGSGPLPYMDGRHGSGYYSREDYIEILQYAHQRHIRVIPEINMPGHARAAIKAMEARYEHFMTRGDSVAAEEYRLTDPDETSQYLSAQLFSDNVVNVARESVYRFLETVLDEVVAMYDDADVPLEMLHVGGDEVPDGAWTQSPMIDEKMEQLPEITQPANMHAYFTQRALEILRDRGLTMAGWEEVALKRTEDGQLIPNEHFAGGEVVPFVWNNLWGAQDLAYRLANREFPVVLSHVTAFYFDLAYSKDPREPGLYWAGFVNTYNAWHYNPFNVFQTTTKDNMGQMIDINTEYREMERLRPDARDNILGLQAQLWSETIKGADMLEYYLLPKLLGFTETAWGKQKGWEEIYNGFRRSAIVEKEWNVFANTLAQRELPRLSHLFGGYNYRIPPPGAVLEEGHLKANVAFPGLLIRYTTDGSEPDVQSLLYDEPVETDATMVKLKAFDTSGNSSRTVVVQ